MAYRRFYGASPARVWAVLMPLAGIGLALLLILQLNARLRPVLLELALAQTANQLTAVIDRAVASQAVSYGELVTLERAENGEIAALSSNMARANVLRAELLDAALDALSGLGELEMSIPLGTILGFDLFSGRGPCVKVKSLYTGTASAEFENQFSSAGINQTCHQIFFQIHADITVLLPGRQHKTQVTGEVCIAETVIVGKVPETYLYLET